MSELRLPTPGAATPFLWVFHVVEPDADLLLGLRRLCDYAILARGEGGHAMAVRLLKTFHDASAPPEFESYRRRLQDVVWRWEASTGIGKNR